MDSAPIPPVPPQAAVRLNVEPGETTIDDKLTFDVELACYEQLHRLTAEMKERLTPRMAGNGRAQLFFLDEALRTALSIAPVVEIEINSLKQAYAGAAATAQEGLSVLTGERPSADRRSREFEFLESMAGPAAVADAAVALLGALRADTRYSGRQVTVPEQAFALTLAHEWESSETVDFHYPTLFVPETPRGKRLVNELVQAFDAALEERKAASQALASLQVRFGQLDAADPKFPAVKAAFDSSRDQFQAAEAVFEDLSGKLTKAEPKTGLTQLQLLERAAFVKSISAEAPGRTFYLFAQVVSAGGAFRTVKNLLRTLFWGDGLTHSGGCVVAYGLFNDGGKLVAADTMGRRSEYLDSRPGNSVG